MLGFHAKTCRLASALSWGQISVTFHTMPRLCCLIAFSRQLDTRNYNNAREVIHTSRFTALSLDGIRMPAPVFGFGVGDVVAVNTLIWKLCKALKDTSDDSKRFRDVQIELLAFNGVISQLQQSIRNAIALPEEEWSVVQKTLKQTKATVEEFGSCIDTFNGAFPDRRGTQAIVDWKRRIVWSLSGKK